MMKVKKMRSVLLVEDEPLIRECLRETFESASFRVIESSNGVEALSVLKQEDVDVVLSDIQMPSMDGLQLLKNLRMDKKDVKFFLMSGHITISPTELHVLGASGIFQKPFIDISDVVRAIANAL